MSVLQKWLTEIPIMMQSTLILGLRGPDTRAAPNIKAIGRWMRGLAFRPGDPSNVREFMRIEAPPRIIEKSETAKELEFCPMHYYGHLMHALEVIAYRHPDGDGAGRCALGLYYDLCSLLHLPFETRQTFEHRLRTRHWPGGVDPETGEDAFAILREGAQ